jgi:hypothetical protein
LDSERIDVTSVGLSAANRFFGIAATAPARGRAHHQGAAIDFAEMQKILSVFITIPPVEIQKQHWFSSLVHDRCRTLSKDPSHICTTTLQDDNRTLSLDGTSART